MTADHTHDELAPGVRAAPGTLRFSFARSSGPGGQNVNKVNTKVELWIEVKGILGINHGAADRLRKLAGSKLTLADEIHLTSDTTRSQMRNRQEALQMLRELIIQAQRVPKMRRKTRPSAASKRRRLDAKRYRGEIKSGRRGQVE